MKILCLKRLNAVKKKLIAAAIRPLQNEYSMPVTDADACKIPIVKAREWRLARHVHLLSNDPNG